MSKLDGIKYKYIRFDQQPNAGRKTGRWTCLNRQSDSIIGIVSWYPGWRQYCFLPGNDTIFSAGCLIDITDFINRAMMAYKSKGN